jgi:hypothetical protein
MRVDKANEIDSMIKKIEKKIYNRIGDSQYFKDRINEESYSFVNNGLYNAAAFQFSNTYTSRNPFIVGH